MIRRLVPGLVLIIGLIFLAGCGGNEAEKPEEFAPPPSVKPTSGGVMKLNQPPPKAPKKKR